MKNLSAKLVLQQNPVFGALDPQIIDLLAGMARNHDYQAGEMVFREGEPGGFLIGIISGNVDIRTASKDGQSLNLNRIGPGEIIGEIAFLDGGPRTASGEASEPTRCFAIPRAPFIRLMDERNQLAQQLLVLVCERVRWTTDTVTDFAFLTPQARLGRRLLHLAAEDREVQISQSELARYLGVSRQLVNGFLREWAKEGLVSLSRGRIRLHSPEQLLVAAGLRS